MSFNPTKPMSMVLKKGKVVDKFCFSLSGAAILSITEQQVTSLEKLFDSTYTAAIQKTNKDLVDWLIKVNMSVPLTTVESLERKISSFLHKCLGLPCSLNSTALYGTSNTLQLPFSGLTEEFGTRGTLEHLLSSCPKALGEGRYRWHHDQVLKAVAESIATAISSSRHQHTPRKLIFIRAGEKPCSKPKTRAGVLCTASDWQLQVDLSKQLKFPQHTVVTSFWPHMIITSEVDCNYG
ncbi:hypothetical protein SRHO_G00207140 [Serrasalmus rhombeus]